AARLVTGAAAASSISPAVSAAVAACAIAARAIASCAGSAQAMAVGGFLVMQTEAEPIAQPARQVQPFRRRGLLAESHARHGQSRRQNESFHGLSPFF